MSSPSTPLRSSGTFNVGTPLTPMMIDINVMTPKTPKTQETVDIMSDVDDIIMTPHQGQHQNRINNGFVPAAPVRNAQVRGLPIVARRLNFN